MSEKNCGTCGWWKRCDDERSKECGSCGFPMPVSVIGKCMMHESGGVKCPCWKERE